MKVLKVFKLYEMHINPKKCVKNLKRVLSLHMAH